MKSWLGLAPLLALMACAPPQGAPVAAVPAPSAPAAVATMQASPPPTVRPNTNIVSTVPGSFFQVQDAATDRAGNIYVASSAGIQKLEVGTYRATLLQGRGRPIYFSLAVADDGTVYAPDAISDQILVIAPDGAVSTRKGAPAFSVRSIAVDHAKNLYLASPSRNRIFKLTPEGVLSVFAGSDAPFPEGKRDGTEDLGEGFVDGQGTAARFLNPQDLTIDAQDNLYVADSGNLAIRRITPDGVVTTYYGKGRPSVPPSPPPGSPQPDVSGLYEGTFSARAIAIDSAGTLYGLQGNQVFRFTPDGRKTLVAGTTISCQHVCADYCPTTPDDQCYRDGQGEAARFDDPQGLGVDPWGRVFVADTYSANATGHLRVIQ